MDEKERDFFKKKKCELNTEVKKHVHTYYQQKKKEDKQRCRTSLHQFSMGMKNTDFMVHKTQNSGNLGSIPPTTVIAVRSR